MPVPYLNYVYKRRIKILCVRLVFSAISHRHVYKALTKSILCHPRPVRSFIFLCHFFFTPAVAAVSLLVTLPNEIAKQSVKRR